MKKLALFIGLMFVVGAGYNYALTEDYECVNISMMELRQEYIEMFNLPITACWNDIFAAMDAADNQVRRKMAAKSGLREDEDWESIHLFKMEVIRRQLARAIGENEDADWEKIDAKRKERAMALGMKPTANWREIFAETDRLLRARIAAALGADQDVDMCGLFREFAIKQDLEQEPTHSETIDSEEVGPEDPSS